MKIKMAQKMLCHFYARSAGKSGFFYSFNVEVTGAARLYRAASSDRRERG
jgi:hypothetical protein